MGRAVACGLLTLDIAQTVERFPLPNEKVQSSGSWVSFGGPAANAAATCAALGVPTDLVSAAGSGTIGRIATEGLVQAGVALIDLAPAGFEPPVSAVVIDRHGDRNVVSRNAGGAPDLPAPAEVLAGSEALLVDGHYMTTAIELARQARAAGIPVLLDSGSWKPGMAELLPLVDVAVLSADFRHSGEGSPADWGPSVVAITHGDGPIEVHGWGERSILPVGEASVIDTLGAGDVLHGALLAALASSGEVSRSAVLDGLRFAADLASHSCRFHGAHGWRSAGTTAWRERLARIPGAGSAGP